MSIKCPKCQSQNIVKKGFRKNCFGKKQKYYCTYCSSWFVEDNGFKKMRFKPEIITRAIHMHNDGMSLFKVKTHLWQYDKIRVTRGTISRWDKKYALFLKSSTQIGKAKA